MASPLLQIIKKEVKEMVRDPRLLLGMIIVPILIFPMMGTAMSASVSSVEESVRQIDLGVVNLDNGTRSDALFDFLAYKDVILDFYSPNEFSQLVENGTSFNVDLFMVVPPDFTVAIESNSSAVIMLYTPMRTYSLAESLPSEIIVGYLSEYDQSVLDERLAESYPGENAFEIKNPVLVGSNSVVNGQPYDTSPGEITNQMMTQSIMIPMVLMILLIMAAQLAATSVAMEKEEKTMETLLTSPVPRSTILFGKIGGVVVISAIAVLAYVFGFSFYMSNMQAMSQDGAGVDLAAMGLKPSLEGMVILFATLFLALVSALSLAVLVASFTEDVRSAQALMGMLYVPIFIPAIVLMFVDISQAPTAIQAVILALPFTYPVLAAKAMYTGEFAILLFGIIYQLIFTAVIIYIASWFFSSEKILTARFNIKKDSGLALWKPKRKR